MQKLRERWGVSSTRVILILIVFSCTGFSVMFLKNPILNLITGQEDQSILHSVIYYILVLPLYNLLLLVYGFIFGQFNFFWNFERRFFARIFGRKIKTEQKKAQ